MNRVEVSRTEKGRVLLTLARATLEAELGRPRGATPSPEWLREEGASFVTLQRAGDLRGCIGSIEARRPLGEDVEANARAAAFEDPRFPPLEAWELADVSISVSLLSPMEPLEFESEDDLVRQLRPGIDGLLLEVGHHRGTFLPAVWEHLKDPALFLRKLKQKAGLAEDFWAAGIVVKRYTTESWREGEIVG